VTEIEAEEDDEDEECQTEKRSNSITGSFCSSSLKKDNFFTLAETVVLFHQYLAKL
jgi:hypothetical protein